MQELQREMQIGSEHMARKEIEIDAKNQEISTKSQEIATKDEEITAKDDEISAKDQEILQQSLRNQQFQSEMEVRQENM